LMRYNAIFQFTYLRVDEPLRVLVLVLRVFVSVPVLRVPVLRVPVLVLVLRVLVVVLRVELAAGVRVVLAVPEVRTRVVVCD